nr:MAG TPA: hypothetical protein [Caudoviricetes sp.]
MLPASWGSSGGGALSSPPLLEPFEQIRSKLTAL